MSEEPKNRYNAVRYAQRPVPLTTCPRYSMLIRH